MNYLSHYWLERHLAPDGTAALARPGALAGLLLVDLAGMRGNGFPLRPLPPDKAPASPDAYTLALEGGMRRHRQIDAWWHGLPAFTAAAGAFRDALRASGSPALRPSLAGHLATEMLADRLLIEAAPIPGLPTPTGLLDTYYYDLRTALAPGGPWVNYLHRHPRAAPFADRLASEAAHFLARPYLYRYPDPQYIPLMLGRIYGHVVGHSLHHDPTTLQALVEAHRPPVTALLASLPDTPPPSWTL